MQERASAHGRRHLPSSSARIAIQNENLVLFVDGKPVAIFTLRPIRVAGIPSRPDGDGALTRRERQTRAEGHVVELAWTTIEQAACTGCELCVQFCPVKSKTDPNQKAINMAPQTPLREMERQNFEFFLKLDKNQFRYLDRHPSVPMPVVHGHRHGKLRHRPALLGELERRRGRRAASRTRRRCPRRCGC